MTEIVHRHVIIGAGAVGGAVAAQLVPAGRDVVLVARGEHGRRIAADGLTVRRPDGVDTVRVPVATGPDEVELKPGDVLVLATKSQDAADAIEQWAWQPVAGGGLAVDLPLVTCQNGLATEREAVRRYRTVIGATWAIAASYLTPGEIVSPSRPPAVGVVWLGPFAAGPDPVWADAVAHAVAGKWRDGGFAVHEVADIGAYKAAKLVGNVANALDLFTGDDDLRGQVRNALQAEAVAVFAAAGITLPDRGLDIAASGFTVEPVPGHVAGRLSTWQSFARGTSSEVDHLNGEVVLLGRLYGVSTPVNEQVQRILAVSSGGRLQDLTGIEVPHAALV